MVAGVLQSHFTLKQFSNEWLSTSGGDWNDATNWSTGVVPLATDDVHIGVVSAAVTINGGAV